MKIQLRNLATNDTLNLEFSDAFTLHDLRRILYESTPPFVQLHLSIDHNGELVTAATLRSLSEESGEIVRYSLDSSYPVALAQKTVAESSGGKLNETNEAIVSDPMSIEEEPSKGSFVLENVGAEPMDITGSKRLSEPLFLKKFLMEECGDTCELTIVVMTVHAAMLDSGFVLFKPVPGMRFSFKDQILPITLNYTLPDPLISANGIESVSLKFQRLGNMVVVYGSIGVGSLVRRVCFDQRKYVHVVDLLMGTLKSEEEDTLSIHSKVLMIWRMIKDGLVTPLLIDFHYKTGSELPPCFMCLPQELKRKIMVLLCLQNIARMACVSSELRDLALALNDMLSDCDWWKQELRNWKDFVSDEELIQMWEETFRGATFMSDAYDEGCECPLCVKS